MRTAIVFVVLAILATTAAADVAVVVWPLDRSFSLPEALMLDDLLSRVAEADESAFLITDASAYASVLSAAADKTHPPDQVALCQFASRWRLDDVLLLEWQQGTVRGLSAQGRQAAAAAEALEQDPRAVAQMLARALISARPVTPPPTTVLTPGGKSGPIAGAGSTSQSGKTGTAPQTGGTPAGVAPSATGTSAAPGATSSPQKPRSTTPSGTKTPSKPSAGETSGTSTRPTGPKPETSPGAEGTGGTSATPGAQPKPTAPSGAAAGTPKKEESLEGRRWYELAVQAYREGNFQLALDRLDRALQAGASQADVLQMRAKIYAAVGNVQGQRRALDELVQIDPKRTRAVVARALLLEQQGLWQEAARTLQAGIAAQPTEPSLYQRLADVYRRQGRTLEALEVLQRGLEATGDGHLALSLARAHDAAGNWRAALALYSKLASDKDTSLRAEALDALGDSYARRGMVEQAVEAYVEAAHARGQAALLSANRYRAVYDATDALVQGHMAAAWQAFEGLVAGSGQVNREQALGALKGATEELGRVLNLCDEALPPPELQPDHQRRQLYYSLLREALAAALTYVDTGRADMLTVARQRMKQALAERPGVVQK